MVDYRDQAVSNSILFRFCQNITPNCGVTAVAGRAGIAAFQNNRDGVTLLWTLQFRIIAACRSGLNDLHRVFVSSRGFHGIGSGLVIEFPILLVKAEVHTHNRAVIRLCAVRVGNRDRSLSGLSGIVEISTVFRLSGS